MVGMRVSRDMETLTSGMVHVSPVRLQGRGSKDPPRSVTWVSAAVINFFAFENVFYYCFNILFLEWMVLWACNQNQSSDVKLTVTKLTELERRQLLLCFLPTSPKL